jgi:hypothetical protein
MFTFVLVLWVAGLMGCDESVNPVLGIDRAFTLYGFFNPQSDTQVVRVFPIEGILEPTRSEPIDAVVSSIDLETGRTHVWRDSVQRYFDGTYGHVYWSPFRAEHEHTYRLEIKSSTGGFAAVEAQVPVLAEPVELEPERGQFNRVILPVFWAGIPRLPRVSVTYVFNVGRYTVSYDLDKEAVQGGWRIPIRLSRDASEAFIFLASQIGSDGRLVLEQIQVRALVGNEDWDPPGGVFNPELLVEPGIFSNVQDGFGFVGAGYLSTRNWLPDSTLLARAGFLTD